MVYLSLLMQSYTLSTLPCGLRLLHIPNKHTAFTYIELHGKVGRRAELDTEVGAAHFLEHLFFDGTSKRPDAYSLSKYLQNHGATRNGVTSQENVRYYVKILADHSEVAFDFVSDIFLNSLLSELDKERKVIAQEAANKRDDPLEYMFRRTLSIMHPHQRLARTIFDEEENLAHITENTLRTYMKRNYVAENFILSVTGNISLQHAQELGQKYFADIKHGQEVTFEPAAIEPKKIVLLENRDLEQSKLAMSFAALPLGDKRSAALWLMSIILGGGGSSRIYNKLRHDLHLVYSVYSGIDLYSDSGYFYIHAFVKEASLQLAVKELIFEINRFLHDGIDQNELQKSKEVALSRLFADAEEMDFRATYYAVQQLHTGNVQDIEARATAIRAVTIGDVMAVAKIVFADLPKVNVLTKTLKTLEVPEIVL